MSSLVFKQITVKLDNITNIKAFFPAVLTDFCNWSQSKVKKKTWKSVSHSLWASSSIMASEARSERTRERATKSRFSHSRLLSRAGLAWLLATPPNGEFARRLSVARKTLLTLTVLSTAPENILPLLNAKAATLPWWRKRVWTQVKLSRFHTYHRTEVASLRWICDAVSMHLF